MHMLKLMQQQVRLGEPLPWGIRDAEGKLLLARGHVVGDAAQLDALLARGACVDVEEVKAAAAAAAHRRHESETARPVNLFTLWERVVWQLDRLLRSVETEPDFAARVDELARYVQGLIDRDTDIAIYLTIRQDPKRLSIYGLAHAVHCALVGVLMARRLGWESEQVLRLMKAALTMNIAMLDLQGRLAAQGVPPTAAQLAAIRLHPAKGVDLLRAAGVVDEDWLQAVLGHHERADGGGYPNGAPDAGELSGALRRLDVFIAKISPRASRASMTIQEAERQLFKDCGGGELSLAVIKEFGIYPPGDLVKLKSGEQAVVVRRSADARAPMVAAITDRHGMPVLTSVQRDTSRPEFAIVGAIGDKSLVLRMPPERLYGLPE